MSGLAPLLREVVATLENGPAQFALVGGLAVSVRTEPRFTRDIDLAVAVTSDAQAERLVASLVPPFALLSTLEHDDLQRLAAVRLDRPSQAQGAVLDLLFASSAIEPEIVADAEPLEVLPSVTLNVATVGHLIALKLLARAPDRPQDEVDLHALRAAAEPGDLEQAASAVRLISDRGAARGRDLMADLRRLGPAG